MGQKVNPYSFRLGVNKPWKSSWFASKKNYAKVLHSDFKIRNFIDKKFGRAGGISHVEIKRHQLTTVIIHTAKPGIVIGRSGAAIDDLRRELEKLLQEKVDVQVQEIRRPDLNAKLIAENIAAQIEKRISFRRAIKQAASRATELGVKGIKVRVAGRLSGADIARAESVTQGKIPLQTIRANIDHAHASAKTTFGIIGIKVSVYNGEIFTSKQSTPPSLPTKS